MCGSQRRAVLRVGLLLAISAAAAVRSMLSRYRCGQTELETWAPHMANTPTLPPTASMLHGSAGSKLTLLLAHMTLAQCHAYAEGLGNHMPSICSMRRAAVHGGSRRRRVHEVPRSGGADVIAARRRAGDHACAGMRPAPNLLCPAAHKQSPNSRCWHHKMRWQLCY